MVREERERTDQTLDLERARTDTELIARTATIDERSDAELRRARERARKVLALARERADRALAARGTTAAERVVLDSERRVEDAVVCDEQQAAAERLRLERDERATALAFLLDTERRATDAMLRAERAHADDVVGSRDDLLAVVAHDLRSLTNVASLNAAVITTRVDPAEPGEPAAALPEPLADVVLGAHRIQVALARMDRLIGDLLDLTALESGRLPVHPAPRPLAPTLREVTEIFQPATADQQLALRLELADPELAAVFDAARLSQVLTNLLVNALKFTPAGGAVTLAAFPADGRVTITVADTGVGLPEGDLDRVFDRMWKGDRADRRGLGLGLYIARRLVAAQGGDIAIARRPEGGTLVTVTLPAA